MSTIHWSTKCIQDLLFIFNLMFIVVTAIILAYGIYYLRYSEYIKTSAYGVVFFCAIVLIIMIISFFGCCGAIKQNFCMTITFAMLLTVLFVLEIIVCICIYALWANVLTHNLDDAMTNYQNDFEARNAVDAFQSGFHCCGIQGPSNWTQYLNAGDSLPFSCCNATEISDVYTCSSNLTDINSSPLYTKGCVEAFNDYISSYSAAIIGFTLGISVVQTLGIAFSCHLAKQIKRYKRFQNINRL